MRKHERDDLQARLADVRRRYSHLSTVAGGCAPPPPPSCGCPGWTTSGSVAAAPPAATGFAMSAWSICGPAMGIGSAAASAPAAAPPATTSAAAAAPSANPPPSPGFVINAMVNPLWPFALMFKL